MSAAEAAVKMNQGTAEQEYALYDGNDIAAFAASQINYHVMGYYPITPSTQVAEYLDELKAKGKHQVHMIPGDGEHGAAGICYGASTAGGRVINATSANGLLFSIEQLPVQSGTRYPMVLNLVSRSVSGPLDIRGDHSDLYFALNTGWVIINAHDPQAVYDMNIMALRIAEHKDVRLPVIVNYDGFFTSHQVRRVKLFKNDQDVRNFVGEYQPPQHVSVDPDNPVTIGPYMNDPDLMNNKYQQHMAMEAARRVIPEVFAEFEKLSGRHYGVLKTYGMEDAEVALFVLNSAYNTAKQAAMELRKQGKKVGVIMPNFLRPFPHKEIAQYLKNVKALVICDRADSYGANGGNMTHEVKSALKSDPENRTLVASRIYGLGGKEFFRSDAKGLFDLAYEIMNKGAVEKEFDYVDVNKGKEGMNFMEPVCAPITPEETTLDVISLAKNEETGRMDVKGVNIRKLNAMPKRIAPGHGACPGCGIFSGLETFLKGITGNVVVLFHTGCGMVVTTGYPYTAHNVTYVHNLFQNGAATMSGIVDMYHERIRRKEWPDKDITFLMMTGDGGHDIGFGPSAGAAVRGHNFILLEYDNEGYMNTGNQLSYTTPMGHATSTSHVGPYQQGKRFHHKDTAQVFSEFNLSYVFTAVESQYRDMITKAAKAQYYAKNYGFVFGKYLSACPLSWRSASYMGQEVVQAAADCCFFPLYEVEQGETKLTYDPEAKGKKIPVADWVKLMPKSKHLVKPENAELLENIQKEIDRRWNRIKKKSETPGL